jgi:hypothetical protein
MTAKDKSQELVGKMLLKHEIPYYLAKECALIAVDEILNLMIKTFKWDVKYNGNVEYWQKVKEEINKL